MTRLDPLRWEKFFASVKHTGQTYSSGLPYTHHLAAVEAVVRRFAVSIVRCINEKLRREGATEMDALSKANSTCNAILSASWLHDSLEDTETKKKELEELFGPRVADLVYAVTNEPGPNRKTRHALTYPKVRECLGATALKLADRIANVEAGGKLVDMYAKEQEDFRRMLFVPGEYEEMWDHLDSLFREFKEAEKNSKGEKN